MSAYPRHDRLVAYLEHCLPVHEQPNGTNRGPIQVRKPDGGVDLFQTHDFVNGGGYAWCVCTWLAAADEAGLRWAYKSPGAYAQAAYASAHGYAQPLGALIPGDPIVWRVGAGHLSTFLSYDKRTGMVQTIDGNVSNRVAYRHRPASLIHTAIHVPEQHAPPPAPEPFWVIATSENGHRQLLYTKFATEKTVLGVIPRLLAQHGRAGITVTRGRPRR